MIAVLSEAPSPGQGQIANAQELAQQTEVARLLGCRIIAIPNDFTEAGTAANALAHIAPFAPRASHAGRFPDQPGVPYLSLSHTGAGLRVLLGGLRRPVPAHRG